MIITLTTQEMSILFQQDPSTKDNGGFQNFLISLQEKIKPTNRVIDLTTSDLEKIPRYAFDYGNGGWEDRLKGIFKGSLGTSLGR